jgi:hypothetical protein
MFSESFWKQPRTFRGGGVRSASLLILDGAIMIRGGRWVWETGVREVE